MLTNNIYNSYFGFILQIENITLSNTPYYTISESRSVEITDIEKFRLFMKLVDRPYYQRYFWHEKEVVLLTIEELNNKNLLKYIRKNKLDKIKMPAINTSISFMKYNI
jgi:hypothetical protein